MKPELQKIGDRVLLYSLAVAILGAVFKLAHFNGANQMLLVGLSSIALAAILKYFPENKPDAYLTGSVIFTGSIAVLFKIMHFPYSGLLVNVAIIVAVVWGIKTLFFPDKDNSERN